MAALAVVEDFDVLEDGMASRSTALENGIFEQLPFQKAEEALYNSMVPTLSLATHADRGPQTGQFVLKDVAGVLAPLASRDEAGPAAVGDAQPPSEGRPLAGRRASARPWRRSPRPGSAGPR